MQQPTLIQVPGQQEYANGSFPLAYGTEPGAFTINDAVSWATENRDRVIQQLEVHGAVLFRDFGVDDPEQFDLFIQAFGLQNFTYQKSLSNAVRVNITDRVFTANEAPPSVSIYLHHEMAQTPVFPSKLFFYCEKAPDVRGETPICRSDILLDKLYERSPEFAEKCAQLGVKYSNTMPPEDDPASGQGRSWRSTLSTDSKEGAEGRLAELGYSWEWYEDGSLRATTPVLPIIRTLKSGQRVFFNQLIAAFRGWEDNRNESTKSIRFGDDTPISTDDMQVAIDLGEELSFDMAWQKGDVVLVDNFLVMHGRRPFEGTRRVLASLVADDGSRWAA